MNILTKYGVATDAQMALALEILKDCHPATNIIPTVELVQQADKLGVLLVPRSQQPTRNT